VTIALDLSTTERAPGTARRLADAAVEFLASLNESQRKAATLPFGDDRRYIWDYRPPESTPRNGLRLINMTPEQRRKAEAVLDIGLSTRGADQVRKIMELETPLREQERVEGRVTPFIRDREHYQFCVFGDPRGREPWAWHVAGHHVAVHFTVVDGDRIASVPLFFGANPSEVRIGPTSGQRTLPEEEDWARALVRSLPSSQKDIAVVNATAFSDILTDKNRVAYPFWAPRGIAYSELGDEHRARLVDLVRHYVWRTSDELSAFTWGKIERTGFADVTFAWAGGVEPGQGHYYAIKGPSFLIEYDNTQNGANHIHSVLRDLTGDWGEDLLLAHYQEAHRNGHGH
jgi:hypothetical protein